MSPVGRICKKCGSFNQPDAYICRRCGSDIPIAPAPPRPIDIKIPSSAVARKKKSEPKHGWRVLVYLLTVAFAAAGWTWWPLWIGAGIGLLASMIIWPQESYEATRLDEPEPALYAPQQPIKRIGAAISLEEQRPSSSDNWERQFERSIPSRRTSPPPPPTMNQELAATEVQAPRPATQSQQRKPQPPQAESSGSRFLQPKPLIGGLIGIVSLIAALVIFFFPTGEEINGPQNNMQVQPKPEADHDVVREIPSKRFVAAKLDGGRVVDSRGRPVVVVPHIEVWHTPKRDEEACRIPHDSAVEMRIEPNRHGSRHMVYIRAGQCEGWVLYAFIKPAE